MLDAFPSFQTTSAVATFASPFSTIRVSEEYEPLARPLLSLLSPLVLPDSLEILAVQRSQCAASTTLQ